MAFLVLQLWYAPYGDTVNNILAMAINLSLVFTFVSAIGVQINSLYDDRAIDPTLLSIAIYAVTFVVFLLTFVYTFLAIALFSNKPDIDASTATTPSLPVACFGQLTFNDRENHEGHTSLDRAHFIDGPALEQSSSCAAEAEAALLSNKPDIVASTATTPFLPVAHFRQLTFNDRENHEGHASSDRARFIDVPPLEQSLSLRRLRQQAQGAMDTILATLRKWLRKDDAEVVTSINAVPTAESRSFQPA